MKVFQHQKTLTSWNGCLPKNISLSSVAVKASKLKAISNFLCHKHMFSLKMFHHRLKHVGNDSVNKSSSYPLVYKHGVLLIIVVSFQTGNNMFNIEKFIVLILKWNSVSQTSVLCVEHFCCEILIKSQIKTNVASTKKEYMVGQFVFSVVYNGILVRTFVLSLSLLPNTGVFLKKEKYSSHNSLTFVSFLIIRLKLLKWLIINWFSLWICDFTKEEFVRWVFIMWFDMAEVHMQTPQFHST